MLEVDEDGRAGEQPEVLPLADVGQAGADGQQEDVVRALVGGDVGHQRVVAAGVAIQRVDEVGHPQAGGHGDRHEGRRGGDPAGPGGAVGGRPQAPIDDGSEQDRRGRRDQQHRDPPGEEQRQVR